MSILGRFIGIDSAVSKICSTLIIVAIIIVVGFVGIPHLNKALSGGNKASAKTELVEAAPDAINAEAELSEDAAAEVESLPPQEKSYGFGNGFVHGFRWVVWGVRSWFDHGIRLFMHGAEIPYLIGFILGIIAEVVALIILIIIIAVIANV
jgi:hypothetical protein